MKNTAVSLFREDNERPEFDRTLPPAPYVDGE
jgi:hypothetical protein